MSMINNAKQMLFTEKYRPNKVSEIILPAELKKRFQGFVDSKEFPDTILAGSAGTGKTTAVMAVLEEIGCDYIKINASKDGNIDTLRTRIQNYASSVSFQGTRKYVILDEADGLTLATQNSLRGFVEEFSANCGFILTCNHINKLSPALRSRCPTINFKFTKKELPALAAQFMKRLMQILEEENIEYDKEVLVPLIMKYCPDWRRLLGEVQHYSYTHKKIDTGILTLLSDESFDSLIGFMKKKEFANVRKWVGENSDGDGETLLNKFYTYSSEHVEKKCTPQLILILAQYQFQMAQVSNIEIQIMAAMIEIMMQITWND